MAQHTYKDISNNGGSQIISGLNSDEPFFAAGDNTEFNGTDFTVARVKKIPLSGLTVYQYEVVESAPLTTALDILGELLTRLQDLT